jgi:hypothetical protein
MCLPKSRDGYDTLLEVTDKFSKRKTFIPGTKSYTAEDWGKLFAKRLMEADWGFPTRIIQIEIGSL